MFLFVWHTNKHVKRPANFAEARGNIEPEKLDSFSFLWSVTPRYPGYVFDAIRVDGFVDEIRQMSRDLTVKQFQDALDRHTALVKEYRGYRMEKGERMNPFTEMRHSLYLSNRSLFDGMLFPNQLNSFLDWVGANRGDDVEAVS